MIRVGAKGSRAAFEPISWDDALDTLASRWRRIIEEDGPQAILPYWYGGSNGWLTGGGMDQRLWNRMGATRIDRTLCAANTKAGCAAVYGDLPSADLLDVEHAELVVLWGVNPSASGIHLVPRIRDLQRRGGRLIVVDPRETPLAAHADLHLRPLPGTDVAVAMAIAHVAFRDGLADRGFLARNAADAPQYEEAVARWTPAAAGRLADVPAGDIERFARMYAEHGPAFLRCGWGVERNRNGTDGVRAIVSLPAVFGKFGVRGGGWSLATSSAYGIESSRWQTPPGSPPAGRTVNMVELARVLEETADPPIRSVYVYDCNPVATVPDQRRVAAALSRPEVFVVVHEQVWTDTCDVADLVLPATTFLEHEELVKSYAGYVVQWSEAVVAPVGEARSNHAVCREIASRLGFGDEPALRVAPRELAQEIASQLPAGARETLASSRIYELPRPIQFGDRWPSRKVELVGPLGPPAWREPLVDADKPLILVSPATPRAISSTGYETLPPGTAVLELSPGDAARFGIAQGDRVRVWNSVGSIEVHAGVSQRVRPGVAVLPKGLWRSATLDGWTATSLAPAHVDPIGGGACFNDARVAVERIA
jgi:anaerobic selenocysteine-containing dehydrogenase